LHNGDRAIACYNSGGVAVDITAELADFGFASTTIVTLRDLYAQKTLGEFTGSWTARAVPPHGVRMLRASPMLSTTTVSTYGTASSVPATSVINATVIGCIHNPPTTGKCVGKFLVQLTPRGEKFPLPIDFSTTPLLGGDRGDLSEMTIFSMQSSILSSSTAIDGDKTKTLGDYSGYKLDVAITHGQSEWPCTLISGDAMPAFTYNASMSFVIVGNFTLDNAGEAIYTCVISPVELTVANRSELKIDNYEPVRE
jgi:hypothetical protein